MPENERRARHEHEAEQYRAAARRCRADGLAERADRMDRSAAMHDTLGRAAGGAR